MFGCGIAGAEGGHGGPFVPAPKAGGFVVVVGGLIAMVIQSFRGQVSTSWCGGGCCSLTERPRRGAKSGGQQQQRSERCPASS